MSAQARILLAIVLLTGVVIAGTGGFMVIEGWPFGDSLFMAVITVSTVGYGEVRPLSDAGRAFTVALIVLAVAALGFSATAIGAYLTEGHLLRDLRRRRMQRAIHKLRGHYVICGGGRFGREVAAEFSRSSAPYLVVDRDPGHCALAGFPGAVFVQGDAEEDETLQEARIDLARGLVAALPADDANLFVVLTARQLNRKLTIIAQATEQRSIEKLRLAGADEVVSPYRIAGHSMAATLLRPAVANFIDAAHRERSGLQIEQVPVPERSPLIGQSIRGAKVSDRTGAAVVAVQTGAGEWVAGADPAAMLGAPIAAGHLLVAVGTGQQLTALRRVLGGEC